MISETIWLKEVGYGAGGSELVFVAFVPCRTAWVESDETLLEVIEVEVVAVGQAPLGIKEEVVC